MCVCVMAIREEALAGAVVLIAAASATSSSTAAALSDAPSTVAALALYNGQYLN